jgi:UDP-GlcNAc:undecaprenyl-phosphate GlcNAc-1-phosphate transferase
MGDTGSLVIGFVLASIAMLGNWRSYELLTSLAVPLMVLAYPIFDTAFVTVIRLAEGRSVFQGGKDHSSHRLALLGLRAKNAVLVIYVICAVMGLAGIALSRVSFKTGMVIISIACAFFILLGVRLSFVGTTRFGRRRGLDGAVKN